VRELPLDRAAHEIGIVFDDRASDDTMAGGRKQLADGAAARVVRFGPRVADGDDEAADRPGRLRLVLARRTVW